MKINNIIKKKKTKEKNFDSFYLECNIKHLEKIICNINSGKAKLVEHELIEEE